MNKHYNHRQTPLLFHRIYWLMWTPAQIVMGFPGIIEAFGGLQTADIYGIADFIYAVLTVFLMAVYFVAFFSWKLHGWYALMAQLVINVIYAFVSLAVTWQDDAAFALSLVIGTLIRCIPVGIYYMKRKPLFAPKGFDIPAAGFLFPGGAAYQGQQNQQWQPPQNDHPQPAASFDENGERAYICPKCGSAVKPTSNFCIHCGTRLK